MTESVTSRVLENDNINLVKIVYFRLLIIKVNYFFVNLNF